MITTITTIYNRDPEYLNLHLESMKFIDVKNIVVDYGSDKKYLKEYRKICRRYGAKLIEVTRNTKPFRQGRAINIGVKAAQTDYIILVDCDILLTKEAVEGTLAVLTHERAMVLCQRIDLNKNRVAARLHPKTAIGSFIGVSRSWLMAIKGVDEFYTNWGRWDDDLKHRAMISDLSIVWLNEIMDVDIMHLYHDPVIRDGLVENAAYYQKNKGKIVRNPQGWGEL